MAKVKICGLRSLKDVKTADCEMPDFVGFVFAQSSRQIDKKTAAKLKRHLNPMIKTVGVFVNQDIDFIISLYAEKILDLIQLHGDEDSAYIEKLRERCRCKIIKAGHPTSPMPENADYLLFDNKRGGSGQTFDWNLLKDYKGPPYFLAGGLNAENVAQAIRMLSPFCVDVSSGVETDGLKDMKKVEAFVRIVRETR
ncbi:MAG: phosphoribosylanthranilate isomerase [Alphaproteobacteria bacterium]|nr:phosphoribosylanthranilate isomerase [Alphaproteobacteria bacterium]